MNRPSGERLQRFYEEEYTRDQNIAAVPDQQDFMYGQVIQQIGPYLQPSMKILDLGCNNGNISLYMALAGCEVVGIDIARNAIETAQKSAEHYKIRNVRFYSLDFIQDWHDHGTFDFILCNHVLEHIPDDRLFLQKIGLALKPGGRFVLMTPTVYSSMYLTHKFFMGSFKFDEDVGHLRRYSRKSLISLIDNAGFDVGRIVYLDGVLREWFILWKPLHLFNHILKQTYIRSLFNGIDLFTSRFLFPATICVHAKLKYCDSVTK